MELKANDLRIGNLLYDRNSELCKVQSLSTEEHSEIYAPVVDGCLTNLPNKPIPLTEEWLLKFGFTFWGSQDDKYCDTDEFYALRIYSNGRIVCEHIDIVIEHVHQLQNLYFALTQTELTIKL